MKTFLLTLTALMSVNTFAGLPVEKTIAIDQIFTPKGFDSNDTTEIVITGYLPNLCHKSPKIYVSKDGKNLNLRVTALSYHKTNPFCPQVAVPFTKKVELGVLAEGDYKIVVNKDTQFEELAAIEVVEPVDSIIDNYIYANVDYIEDIGDGDYKVTLRGYNPSYCLELDRVEFKSNGENTYSVLPIMKQVNELCPMKLTPFEYEVEIPKDLKVKKILLHVRSMDGSSINRVVTFQ